MIIDVNKCVVKLEKNVILGGVMSKDMSGPAFPIPLNAGENYSGHGIADGMTLREYFAAHAPITYNEALAHWYGAPDREKGSSPMVSDVVAMLRLMRYAYADEMLAGREKD